MSDVTCSVEDCAKPVTARGWCNQHYKRWKTHGDPLALHVKSPKPCAAEGCERVAHARGWCRAHYQRWVKYRDPAKVMETPLEDRPRSTCGVSGCDREISGQGWCSVHLQRFLRTGNPLEVRTRELSFCSIDGCERVVHAMGWCTVHHGRWRRNGDPERLVHLRGDDLARFWAYVNKLGPIGSYRPELGPCWLWTSTLTDDGYSKVSWSGRQRSAHRLAYELRYGAIPKGLEIDHLCMVRHCVNPAHLQAVTKAENNRRARLAAAGHAIGHKDGIRLPASSQVAHGALTLTA